MLQTPYVDNLLLPGYAANIDSYSWSAMRVYPNLIMLGDAAGTSAALAADGRMDLAKPDMDLLQKELLRHQAILEK
ncbi:FAD dependent oxidoreductase [compost metagenome]